MSSNSSSSAAAFKDKLQSGVENSRIASYILGRWTTSARGGIEGSNIDAHLPDFVSAIVGLPSSPKVVGLFLGSANENATTLKNVLAQFIRSMVESCEPFNSNSISGEKLRALTDLCLLELSQFSSNAANAQAAPSTPKSPGAAPKSIDFPFSLAERFLGHLKNVESAYPSAPRSTLHGLLYTSVMSAAGKDPLLIQSWEAVTQRNSHAQDSLSDLFLKLRHVHRNRPVIFLENLSKLMSSRITNFVEYSDLIDSVFDSHGEANPDAFSTTSLHNAFTFAGLSHLPGSNILLTSMSSFGAEPCGTFSLRCADWFNSNARLPSSSPLRPKPNRQSKSKRFDCYACHEPFNSYKALKDHRANSCPKRKDQMAATPNSVNILNAPDPSILPLYIVVDGLVIFIDTGSSLSYIHPEAVARLKLSPFALSSSHRSWGGTFQTSEAVKFSFFGSECTFIIAPEGRADGSDFLFGRDLLWGQFDSKLERSYCSIEGTQFPFLQSFPKYFSQCLISSIQSPTLVGTSPLDSELPATLFVDFPLVQEKDIPEGKISSDSAFLGVPINSIDLPTFLNSSWHSDILTPAQTAEFRSLLQQFRPVFDRVDPRNPSSLAPFEVKTHSKPPKRKPWVKGIGKHSRILDAFLQRTKEGYYKLIQSSEAEVVSNGFGIAKKDKTIRELGDYRGINSVTIKDDSTMLPFHLTLHKLKHSNFFTVLDLRKGFHQIRLTEAAAKKLVIGIGSLYFQPTVMPFGPTNCPAHFNSEIAKLLSDFCDFSYHFFDDILIFSQSWGDHVKHVTRILETLASANLKVNLAKCQFCASEVDFLYYHITRTGYSPKNSIRQQIKALKPPSSLKQLRSLLGCFNVSQSFIPGFAKLASPFYTKLSSTATRSPFSFSQEDREALDRLKSCQALVLEYPDVNSVYGIYTDASTRGLGAILVDSKSNRIVQIASRTLSKSELNYTTLKLEFASIIFALRKFSPFIQNNKFHTVYNDHDNLIDQLTQVKPSRTAEIWLSEMHSFNILFQKIAGRDNSWADYLSRYPSETAPLTLPSVLSIRSNLTSNKSRSSSTPPSSNSADPDVLLVGSSSPPTRRPASSTRRIPKTRLRPLLTYSCSLSDDESLDSPEHFTSSDIPANRRLTNSARTDPVAPSSNAVQVRPPYDTAILDDLRSPAPSIESSGDSSSLPSYRIVLPEAVTPNNSSADLSQQPPAEAQLPLPSLPSQAPPFVAFPIDVLREAQSSDPFISKLSIRPTNDQNLIVDDQGRVRLPSSLFADVVRFCHASYLCHSSLEPTLHLMNKRYSYPNMRSAVSKLLKSCPECQLSKGYPTRRHTLSPISIPKTNFTLLGCDILGPLHTSSRDFRYVLSIICYRSKFAFTVCLKQATTSTVVNAMSSFFDTFCCHPSAIICDSGSQFTSADFKRFLDSYQIELRIARPGHQQTNGAVEAFHKAFVSKITAISNNNPRNWDDKISRATRAHNSARHSSTSLSPCEVAFQRAPRFSIDSAIHSPNSLDREVLEAVDANLLRTHWKHKQAYDHSIKRLQNVRFQMGDLVLLYDPPSAKKKFLNSWKGPFKIVGIDNHHNYTIQLRPGARKRLANVSNLKPFISNQDNYDLSQLRPEVIVDHYTDATRGTLLFRVKFSNRDHHSNQWVSQESITDHNLVRDYVRSLKLDEICDLNFDTGAVRFHSSQEDSSSHSSVSSF